MTKGTGRAWSLPPGLERLWDEPEPDRRRPGLNLREIVTTAVEMADRNGLDDVTMARLARRLGFSTMALYRHVPHKSALVTLMVDAAVGKPSSAPREAGNWRDHLHGLAHELSRVYRAHSWLLDVPISGPPATPSNLRWFEAGLAACRATPLDLGEKTALWLLIAGHVRGKEQLFLELGRGLEAIGDGDAYADVLRRFADPAQFPELTRALDAHAFDDVTTSEAENDADFEFGLQRVLDGIEVFIDRRE